ncbi:formyltransferase family protein [Alphaproteobacteria bacterium]|nr:formyltransferase family protein [Alphaproteobacteria bacterium]
MKKYSKGIVCLAGKNEIAVFGLKLLLKYVQKENIRVIYNSKDPGYDTWQPSLLKVAREHNLSIISIEDFYNLDDLVFLSLEFYKVIIPSKFSNSFLFNIHFSNLPAYKGMFTSALPILNNEQEAGVTLHEIDAGIDTGDIIDQINFPISQEETARDLYFKYLSNSKNLLERNLTKILDGGTKSIPQKPEGSTYFSVKTIDYENLKVKLFATAEQIKNQIRAYFFPEYQVPKVHGFSVNAAIIQPYKSKNKPGTLLSVSKTELLISTTDFDLVLCRDKDSELIEAARINDEDFAAECLKFGANIDTKRGGDGLTPLITASFNGSSDVLELLINRGANINGSDYNGMTPLMHALLHFNQSGNRILFDLLLKNGAELEVRDAFQKTIYDYAREKNILDLV